MMDPEDIRALLLRLGISQTEAARLVGVDARTVRRWIAGDKPVPLPAERLLRLVAADDVVMRRLDGLVTLGDVLDRN